MRLTAFFKPYKMGTLLHRSKLNILAKNRIPFGDHPLKLERYREDLHGPCARMTRTNREEYTIFISCSVELKFSEHLGPREQRNAAGPALFSCGLKRPLDESRSALRQIVREGESHKA